MILTCCSHEGEFCSTFGTADLSGPVWRVTHGHEGTEAEQKRMTEQIQASLALVKPRDGVPIAQVTTQNVQPKKTGGCSKCQKQRELMESSRKRIKEQMARRAKRNQKPS